jgi:hypothetical protein
VRTKRDASYYMGGRLGGNKRSTTYLPSARPGDSGLQKARQALVRRFGNQTLGSAAAGRTGHTANSSDTGTIPSILGQWSTIHLEIADNSSETITFGPASDIAAIFCLVEIKRNFATPIRELRP